MTPPPDTTSPPAPVRATRRLLAVLMMFGLIGALIAVGLTSGSGGGPAVAARASAAEDKPRAGEPKLEPAPDLTGGVAWLNTAGPVHLKDLRGKVVILDFWTLCCINCIHVMPDLAKLEKKYPNNLVVIGVHSPKFDNEKDTASIRKAILRYEIAHPVVNDADRKIWDRFGVQSWPTIAVIDPEGMLLGAVSGEGNYDILDRVVAKLIAEGKEKKTLNEKPLRFDLARYRESGDTPLFFPGKVVPDAKNNRLFIADSTHHRIVITDLSGKKLAVAGTGVPGFKDGDFASARFDDPQGMALDGDTLYVADRKNHSIRALDLKTGTVRTAAGVGVQTQESRFIEGLAPASTTGLNSPWDLLIVGRQMYVAMAGHHQLWVMDLDKKAIGPFAGDGRENIKDGPLPAARFAQPSGLATDGKYLYVADSEVSAIRRVSLDPPGRVDTLVGEGLFEFGDKDGVGPDARLQHALGVAVVGGKVLVADTYNNKLKMIDPATRECRTFLGGGAEPLFHEPAGISVTGDTAYVADTNAHRIRVVDLKTKAVRTLELTGVEPPPPLKEWQPPAPLATGITPPRKAGWYEKAVARLEAKFEPAEAKPGETVTYTLTVTLNPGYTTYPTAQPDLQAAGLVNTFTFPDRGPVVFVGDVTDPPNPKIEAEPALGIKEIHKYGGVVVYERKAVVLPTAKPGTVAVKLPEFKLSVCDAKVCYDGKSLTPAATLRVLDGPPTPVDPKYATEVKKATGNP